MHFTLHSRMTWASLFFVQLVLALVLGGCTKQEANEVKVGVISPLTGPAASFGVSQKNGTELALEDINAKGGINGKKVIAVYEDSQLDPNKALSAFKKLVSVDKVPVVIGQGSTTEILALAPASDQSKIILVSPGASGAKITGSGKYIFRLSPSDAFQGTMAANFAAKKGFKKGAIIYVNNDWGNGLKDGFEKDFKLAGNEIVSSEAIEPASKDFKTVLVKIKTKSPDFVYIPIHPDQAGVLLKQAKELGAKLQFIGADSFSEKSILTVAGNSAEGVIFTMPAKTSGAAYDEFQRKYKAKFNSEASYIAAVAYDAMVVTAKAISESGSDAEKIKQNLQGVKGYQGVSGDITFDKNGDVINKKFDLMTIVNGEYKLL